MSHARRSAAAQGWTICSVFVRTRDGPDQLDQTYSRLCRTHVFRDEGYSGSRLDRPGLDALRDAVRDAEIDVVAVVSPDRLARKYA
jgi:DNA invertase Pin-like site-specific DNA recombinase